MACRATKLQWLCRHVRKIRVSAQVATIHVTVDMRFMQPVIRYQLFTISKWFFPPQWLWCPDLKLVVTRYSPIGLAKITDWNLPIPEGGLPHTTSVLTCNTHLSHVVGNVQVHVHAHDELDQILGQVGVLMDDGKVKRSICTYTHKRWSISVSIIVHVQN